VSPLRGNRFRYAALLAATIAVTACEPPTDPIGQPPRRLVIHAVLNPAAGDQVVKVEHLDGEFGHALRHVPGAQVTITTPDGQVLTGIDTLISTADRFNEFMYVFRDLGWPTALVPGGTYTLRVLTPDGEEATGSTTIPESQLPNTITIDTLYRERDTLRLSWGRVPSAARYMVNVQTRFEYDSVNVFTDQTYRAFTDTSIAIPGTARTLENERVFVPEIENWVMVSAVDANYYTYFRPTADPFAGAPPSKLTGAAGVFGSIAPVRVHFLEVR
jgi:hypothetical protein